MDILDRCFLLRLWNQGSYLKEMFSEENFGGYVDQMAMGERPAQTEGIVCSWLVGILTLCLLFIFF